nr:Fructose-1,6-bisphosphatase/inositol-1-monophosphatase [Cryobacterium sp. SO1]
MATVADHEAENALALGLARIRPRSIIIGEEAAGTDPGMLSALDSSEDVWLVDALDGTDNIIAGSADYGMMIALVRDRVTLLGAIFQPQHDRMFLAKRGMGATLNGSDLLPPAREVLPVENLAGSIHTRFLDRRTTAQVHAHASRLGNVTPITRCAAIEYPLIAHGVRDFALFGRTRPWDHAAGTLLVTETGGTATRLDGTPYLSSNEASGLLVAGGESVERQLREALELV